MRSSGLRPNHLEASVDHPERVARKHFASSVVRHNAVLTIATASLAPIVYLIFIYHYAVNVLYNDDWSVIPMVDSALHGHLALSQLWGQYNESRLFIGNVVVIIFGFIDRLDLRSLIFFGALAYIASYAGLLLLLRHYLDSRLTPIPVLVVGLIWFSLADVQNALWAFQESWYLTLCFFITMLVALLVPNSHRWVWFAIAVLLAFAASLTTVQGFLCWPLGAICLLWRKRLVGRARIEIVVWLGALVANVALYLPGYNASQAKTCVTPSLTLANCSIASLLGHPWTAFGFFLGLIGNVVPGDLGVGLLHDVARFEVVGAVLLAAAVFVVIQSWRHRASFEGPPLPLLLIVFSLLFDVVVSIGRAGTGAAGAISNSRYDMANLILLTGVVIYICGQLRRHSLAKAADPRRRSFLTYLALFLLGILLVVQMAVSTGFGLNNALMTSTWRNQDARFLVSIQFRGLTKEVGCELFLTYPFPEPHFTQYFGDAVADQLGEFAPGSDHYYHKLGLPPAGRCGARH